MFFAMLPREDILTSWCYLIRQACIFYNFSYDYNNGFISSQITMLCSSFPVVLSSITSLGTGGPLYNLTGNMWCRINWFSGVGFYILNTVNSFCLAFYRMFIMRYLKKRVLFLNRNTTFYCSGGHWQERKLSETATLRWEY